MYIQQLSTAANRPVGSTGMHGTRVRVQLIRHFKTCTTDIYLQNDCAYVGLSVHAPKRARMRGTPNSRPRYLIMGCSHPQASPRTRDAFAYCLTLLPSGLSRRHGSSDGPTLLPPSHPSEKPPHTAMCCASKGVVSNPECKRWSSWGKTGSELGSSPVPAGQKRCRSDHS